MVFSNKLEPTVIYVTVAIFYIVGAFYEIFRKSVNYIVTKQFLHQYVRKGV